MYDLPLLWVSRFMFLRFVCVFAHFAKQHMSLAHAPNMHSGVRIFTHCPEYFIFTQCHVSICNKITGTLIALICVCYFLQCSYNCIFFVFVFAPVVSRPPTLHSLTGPAGVLKRAAVTDQQLQLLQTSSMQYSVTAVTNQQ